MFKQLSGKRYGTILVDPPWKFEHWGKTHVSGRDTEVHYPLMTLAQIEALPVSDLAADDCVLFLWITDPLLEKAFRIIKRWGFAYKTVGFYWVKLTGERPFDYATGLGYWTRANPEQCLLATRGHPKRLSKKVQRLIVAPRAEHSRKPAGVHERIMQLVPGPYLELFARERIPGWDSWGNQLGRFKRHDLLEGL